MENIKGDVLIDTLIAVLATSIIVILVYSLTRFICQVPKNEEEDYFTMQELWKEDIRCKIYCPKDDPILDITF